MVDYQKMSFSYLVPEHLRGNRFATIVWILCVCDEHTRRQLEEDYTIEPQAAPTTGPNRRG